MGMVVVIEAVKPPSPDPSTMPADRTPAGVWVMTATAVVGTGAENLASPSMAAAIWTETAMAFMPEVTVVTSTARSAADA